MSIRGAKHPKFFVLLCPCYLALAEKTQRDVDVDIVLLFVIFFFVVAFSKIKSLYPILDIGCFFIMVCLFISSSAYACISKKKRRGSGSY